jgi:hypothetical protein
MDLWNASSTRQAGQVVQGFNLALGDTVETYIYNNTGSSTLYGGNATSFWGFGI